MASFHGIAAVCEAIAHILDTAMTEEEQNTLGLSGSTLTFSVYQSDDFGTANTDGDRATITAGASIFLYRVMPNLSHRTPSGRTLPDGSQQLTQLPVDLHLIVTIRGGRASTQNLLVGWVMRTLEDYPVIPATVLNHAAGNLFSSPQNQAFFANDEAVELVLGEMSGEELLQLWDTLGDGDGRYQISIPYLVRNLFIDSTRSRTLGAPVQVRTADIQALTGGTR
ncbi:MAG: DUF4255 domain-containing protein [Cyanobacteria bacterium J06639_14]